jgi:predicted nucleic acid-binding protein
MADFGESIKLRIVNTRYEFGYLVDTGILLAMANPGDSRHDEATQCMATVSARGLPIFVSLPTIYETHRRILFDVGIPRAREFLGSIFDGSTLIVAPDIGDEEHAIAWIDRFSDQCLTLTDAVNMAILARMRLSAVMSFDVHFLIGGFLRVPPVPN